MSILRTLIAVAIAVTTLAAATPPISLESRNFISSTPGYFKLRITLEPDERNRSLCLQWIQVRSGHGEKTGCWSVDALREPRTTWKEVKDLSAGKYDVVAWVIQNDERIYRSNPLTLIVIGLGYESDPE